ncbi:MAG: thioredoxin domain-containing protein [Candidatus Micrarchaeota archaeon]
MKKLVLVSIIFLAALLFGCAQQETPTASVTPSAASSMAASANAFPSAIASPTASPSPRPSPSPIWVGSPSPGAWNDFGQSEVLVDFLYADWCSHCQKMKPIVSEAERAFPAQRFKIRSWNEANRTKDKSVMYVYDYYSRKGLFDGYPTFVIAGGYKRVGEMPRADFFDWACSFFHDPRPDACSQYANKTW